MHVGFHLSAGILNVRVCQNYGKISLKFVDFGTVLGSYMYID